MPSHGPRERHRLSRHRRLEPSALRTAASRSGRLLSYGFVISGAVERVTGEPPPNTPVTAILPTEPLLRVGAGRCPIPQAVAQANGFIINHLGPTMDRVIQNVKQMAACAFQTRSSRILGLAGPGSAAMGDGGFEYLLARTPGAVSEERHVQRTAGRDGGRCRRLRHISRE